jgi:hypothetical protein
MTDLSYPTPAHLQLEPSILVSTLRGEETEECVAILDRVLSVAKARLNWLGEQPASGLRTWPGERTEVVIAPSSEVLNGGFGGAAGMVTVLARIGRAAGINLRLLDATPPLPGILNEDRPPVYSLNTFGGSMVLRATASEPEIDTVTFHEISVQELMAMAENS